MKTQGLGDASVNLDKRDKGIEVRRWSFRLTQLSLLSGCGTTEAALCVCI
jgi:hypothetical protein